MNTTQIQKNELAKNAAIIQADEEAALLAGLSILTVINLKHSEDEYINVTHARSSNNGKYLGWITTLEGRGVINTDPIFDTPKDAEDHMRRVIAAARSAYELYE